MFLNSSLLGNNTWVSEIKIAEIIPRWEKWASLLKTATFCTKLKTVIVIKERINRPGGVEFCIPTNFSETGINYRIMA